MFKLFSSWQHTSLHLSTYLGTKLVGMTRPAVELEGVILVVSFTPILLDELIAFSVDDVVGFVDIVTVLSKDGVIIFESLCMLLEEDGMTS